MSVPNRQPAQYGNPSSQTSSQPYPTQPYPAQPYPGQPYPAQPYPAQPYPPQHLPPQLYQQQQYPAAHQDPRYTAGAANPIVGAGANVLRGSTFHTLRTLRGPVRLVLRLLSILFGLATIGGVLMGMNQGSWGLAITMFIICVVINAVRWWYDSAIARTAPPNTTIYRPL